MKRARASNRPIPRVVSCVIAPGALEHFYGRMIELGKTGPEPVSKKKPSSAVTGKARGLKEIRHEQ